MSKAVEGGFDVGALLAAYTADLEKIGIDIKKIERHVCCFEVNQSWELCYAPSYSDTIEFRSSRPPTKNSLRFDAKRAALAECVERIMAYELGCNLEQWSGDKQFNRCTIAFNAKVATDALRDLLEKARCISEKRSAAAKRRHEIPEIPVRTELGRLLGALKPTNGWRDEGAAVKVVLPHIQDYIRRVRPGMQLGAHLGRVLTKWIKTHPEVVHIFAEHSAAK